MKNSSKGVLSALLAGVLVTGTSVPALASASAAGQDSEGASNDGSLRADAQSSADASKTQVVYAKADAQGALEGAYVVNSFEADEGGTVVDEGAYESVAGLTDSRAVGFSETAGLTTFDVSADEQFSYQGNLDAQTQMPWNVSVSYELDGTRVDPDELAGKTGRVAMTLEITPNGECEGDWADNYLLQVSGTFAGDTTRVVSCEKANAAQSGDDIQLTYMVFPGSSVEYVVEADVKDFEFGGWQMVGIPLSLAFDVDDDEFSDATEQLSELTDAIAQVDEGASSLSDGAGSLSDGAQSMADGTHAVGEGVTALNEAGSSLAGGLSSASAAFDTVIAGANSLAAGTGELVAGAEALAAGSTAYASGLASQASDLRAQAAAAGSAEAIQAALEQTLSVLATSTDPTERAQASAQAQQLIQALAAVSSATGAASALDGAAAQYSQLDGAIQGMVDETSDSSVYALNQGAISLAQGLGQLSGALAPLEEGMGSYVSGVSSLASSYGALEEGADELASGARELEDGASTLADGTSQLADETSDLDSRMVDELRDKIDEMLNPDFIMRDFVNGNEIERVQFVIKTASIEVEDN